jgi:hypothetical protein
MREVTGEGDRCRSCGQAGGGIDTSILVPREGSESTMHHAAQRAQALAHADEA